MSNDLVRLDIADVVIDGPSLEIGSLSLEQFEDLGRKLRSIEGHSQFWIGDWANSLHDQYGKGSMTQLAGEIGYDVGTVWNYADVARKYDSSLRSEVLENYPQLTHRHSGRCTWTTPIYLKRRITKMNDPWADVRELDALFDDEANLYGEKDIESFRLFNALRSRRRLLTDADALLAVVIEAEKAQRMWREEYLSTHLGLQKALAALPEHLKREETELKERS